ncbi:synaptosomal-associated protein 29-like [Danaus plexippus]|uniref:Synaptosomal-associated protein 29 n=1 Tax=Danaus plexippus plexippus TaxID=278856 RepID=A0A212FMQ4_DANPL|nr:synaptosomal-associated protein 29-like [Danaus plexippus]OWR54979.1 synaptosomal-associated protein 29 [Danaus plexippus plexippus]
MSGHRYISNSNNLFEDDDVDDDTFVNSYRPRVPPPAPKASPYYSDLERQKKAYLEKQKEIHERTVESSFRSIGLLRDSENIGIATAEELARQREALENTSRRLDDINTNLTTSQKHLNGIKSVFYGFKNYLSDKTEKTPPKSTASPGSRSWKAGTSSRVEEATSSGSEPDNFRSHPTTRLRGLDDQMPSEPMSGTQNLNKILDANLDEMVTHITRLKGLGMALGEEIETQNNLIDEIHNKADIADIKIGQQNKQMNKLLGK